MSCPGAPPFSRKAAGTGGGAQVVAANVDVGFLVASLNSDLNPRRLERYLASAWQSGAAPVVLLTKADLCPDLDTAVARIEGLAAGAPVHAICALTGQGLDALAAYLAPGRTAVMVGSSGVGKSTLLNVLLGADRMVTQAVREDDGRGRHTTSHRELILLPGGGLLLDTPGMRELGLWDSDKGLTAAFEDIESPGREVQVQRLRPHQRAGLRGEGGHHGRRLGRGRGGGATRSCSANWTTCKARKTRP